MKCHLPQIDNVVTIGFLAKVSRNFARIYGSYHERFGIFIDIVVKPPFETAWAFSEFDGIVKI